MNVSLTPELEKFVEQQVKSGLYSTASEVVRDSLRMLKDREQFRQLKLEELRKEVQIGIDEADRGELVPFDAALVERIKKQGRRRLAARKAKVR